MRYWLMAMRKYATFRGRASPNEYWAFVVMSIPMGVGLLILDTVTGISRWAGWDEDSLLIALYGFAMWPPSASAAARRLHDINRTGWWQVVPGVNLIMLCWLGNEGANSYGPPHYV